MPLHNEEVIWIVDENLIVLLHCALLPDPTYWDFIDIFLLQLHCTVLFFFSVLSLTLWCCILYRINGEI